MPSGDKSKYTDKQKRQAEHIEVGYKEQGVPEDEAEGRAWATVNKNDGGGKKPGGSGYDKSEAANRKSKRKIVDVQDQKFAAKASTRKPSTQRLNRKANGYSK